MPLGKPQPGLFEMAAQLAGSRKRVMLGDQIETDILGAARFGIDSGLVMRGVSRDGALSQALQPTDRIDLLADLLKGV